MVWHVEHSRRKTSLPFSGMAVSAGRASRSPGRRVHSAVFNTPSLSMVRRSASRTLFTNM